MEQEQLNAVWQEIYSELTRKVAGASNWLSAAKPIVLTDSLLSLGLPTKTHCVWIKEHYWKDLKETTNETLKGDMDIELLVIPELAPEENNPQNNAQYPQAGAVRETPDAPKSEDENKKEIAGESVGIAEPSSLHLIAPGDKSTLNPKYTFDTFVTGGSNQFAHAAAIAVATHPGKTYNPYFMYGGVGLGKTHLMHAIGNKVIENNPAMRVLYVTSEQFTNEVILAIQKGMTSELRRKYRTIDVLMVDDIQFISGKTSTQEEFFNTFNALHGSNKQIILSSDRPPKEVQKLEERLRSRFEGGLITDIQTPDLETRIAILKNKAQLDSIDVPDDVMVYIASRIDSNIRELEGALTRVVSKASIYGKKITTDFAAETLKDVLQNTAKKKITLEIVEQMVSRHYKVDVEDFHSKKKSRSIAFPRQMAMYLGRVLTESSYPQIGEYFGGRDHTTVLHAYEKISKEKDESPELAATIRQLTEDIKRI